MKGILNHIEINVSDLKRSVEFWGWLLEKLGYEKYQEWNGGISWKLNETYIIFVQTDKKYLELPFHRRHTGLNHLAFFADLPSEIDSLTEDLKNKNIPILYLDKHPYAAGKENYAVFFEDPDRIKVEIVVPV